MQDHGIAPLARPDDAQQAVVALRTGERTRIGIGVRVTSTGLLSIAALVSSILLSSAVIVYVATRAPVADKARRRR